MQKHRDKDESVRSNMQQYGKDNQYLDVIVADASLPLWRPSFKLDCIITDRRSQYLYTFQNGLQMRHNLKWKGRALTDVKTQTVTEHCHGDIHTNFVYESFEAKGLMFLASTFIPTVCLH